MNEYYCSVGYTPESLSPDCRRHVFVFLSLFDCLRFAETSRTCLKHVILEVERRRREQFLISPCEEYSAFRQLSSALPVSIRLSELPHNDKVLHPTNTNEYILYSDNDHTIKRKPDRQETVCKENPFLYPTPCCNENINESYYTSSLIPCERSWYVLPSVLERIEGLYRAIPSSHPFNDILRNLILDLKAEKEYPLDDTTCPLRQLSSVTFAHRLHASLLSQSTIQLDPHPFRQRTTTTNNDKESLTVTLERYIGDVLTASCLIGHTNYSGRKRGDDVTSEGFNGNRTMEDYGSKTKVVVEGGPSLDRWLEYLLSFVPSAPNTTNSERGELSPMVWYKYCVFLHSSLLRVSPLSISQSKQLSCEPLSGLLEPVELYVENDQGERNNTAEDPLVWFSPSRTYSCFSPNLHDMKALTQMKELFSIGRNQKVGLLETTLNHFGPLGPSFRGRDRITTESMFPHKLYERLLRNSLSLWNLHNGSWTREEQRSDARLWLSGTDERGVFAWMKLLKDQSLKTRPMTVQPPLVTIRMDYLPTAGGI